MRIIDPGTEATSDYLLARERGDSCTIRPAPGFPAEEFVMDYAGPPALITWYEIEGRHIAWAVPYTALELRAENTQRALALDNPKLVFNSAFMGYATGHQWIKRMGGRMVSPDAFAKRGARLFAEEPIDTLFATPRSVFGMVRRQATFKALRHVVIFTGCGFLDQDQVDQIRTFFAGVRVTVAYWRSWAGIVSVAELANLVQPADCGPPVNGIEVAGRAGRLYARGVNVEGVQLLTRDGIRDFGAGWVPLLNTGAFAGGHVFVTGEVAGTTQLDAADDAKVAKA